MENKNRNFIVNNLQQLKSVLLDNCGVTLNVSLIDEKNQYDKQKLNFLMSIDKTSSIYQKLKAMAKISYDEQQVRKY